MIQLIIENLNIHVALISKPYTKGQVDKKRQRKFCLELPPCRWQRDGMSKTAYTTIRVYGLKGTIVL